MIKNHDRIGLALSGGGIRATIFHLGVLAWLAKANQLEQVNAISTVSGASLGMALVFSVNGYRWPTSTEYLHWVLPNCKEIILNHDLGGTMMKWKTQSPGSNTVLLMAKALEEEWGIRGDLQRLPSSPRWEINATTFETGENFRFSRARIGDDKLGFALNPEFPISHAAAASGAYPELVGEYVLDMTPLQWYCDPSGKRRVAHPRDVVHLWDGAVYDNLGLEALYRPNYGLAKDIDYLLVSDASAPMKEQEWSDDTVENLLRIWDIGANEIQALLLNNLNRDVLKEGNGSYLSTGETVRGILKECHASDHEAAELAALGLSTEEAEYVRDYPTTLISPSPEDFEKIFQHGIQLAQAISYCGK